MTEVEAKAMLADRLKTRREALASAVNIVEANAPASPCSAHAPVINLNKEIAGGMQDILEVQEIELRSSTVPAYSWKQILIGLAALGALISGAIKGPEWLKALLGS